MRAVLSARSRCSPRREDQYASLRSMGREAEASKRSEVSCTKRKNFASSSRVAVPLLQSSCSSIQALLMVSHISEVSAVRTERELRRAFSMQFLIEEGLTAENDRYSTTLVSLASLYFAKKLSLTPAVSNADSHSLVLPI